MVPFFFSPKRKKQQNTFATKDHHSCFFVRLKTSLPPLQRKGATPKYFQYSLLFACFSIEIFLTFKLTFQKRQELLSNILKFFKISRTKVLSIGEDLGEAVLYVRISFLLKNQTAAPNKTPICANKIKRLFLIAGQFSMLPFMGTLSSSIAM